MAGPEVPSCETLASEGCSWSDAMKIFFVLLIAAGVVANSAAVFAKTSSVSRADRIKISYVPPKNPDHQAVFELLKERQVLEKFKGFLSQLRMPCDLPCTLLGLDVICH